MPIETAGFTCTKPAAGEDRHCVKFTDSRCSGQPANLKELTYGEKAPPGCFLDYSNDGTYLDDTLLQEPNTGEKGEPRRVSRRPLINLHTVGTKSNPSKIYRMLYRFAPDELTDDSKTYKALVAKYGEPSEKDRMRWRIDDTKLQASCNDRFCDIAVEDSKFEELENRRQQETDASARHQNASAPKL